MSNGGESEHDRNQTLSSRADLDAFATCAFSSEQHDDQLFFEILRCIKGLTTSDVRSTAFTEVHRSRLILFIRISQPGKEAIIEHGVTPFRELVDLLYSEKKPGEVSPKQLIVDLVFSLFDIYRSGPRTDGRLSTMTSPTLQQDSSPLLADLRCTNPPTSKSFAPNLPISGNGNTSQGSSNGNVRIPGGYETISAFILSLLREPVSINDESSSALPTFAKENRKSIIIAPASELPAPKVEMHDFIAAAHKPRIFKTYMKELSQACWDFFWLVHSTIVQLACSSANISELLCDRIMHYSKNGIWNLADVDQEKIRPRAPNGASAGVEFEAMRYLVRLVRVQLYFCCG